MSLMSDRSVFFSLLVRFKQSASLFSQRNVLHHFVILMSLHNIFIAPYDVFFFVFGGIDSPKFNILLWLIFELNVELFWYNRWYWSSKSGWKNLIQWTAVWAHVEYDNDYHLRSANMRVCLRVYRVAQKVSHFQESSLNGIKYRQCSYISHQFLL